MSMRMKLLIRTACCTSSAMRRQVSSGSWSRPIWVSFRLTIGIELAAIDLVQQLMIAVGAGDGLFATGDVLAQVVDADANAAPVHLLDRDDQVIEGEAGDKTAGQLAAQRRMLGEAPQGLLLG